VVALLTKLAVLLSGLKTPLFFFACCNHSQPSYRRHAL